MSDAPEPPGMLEVTYTGPLMIRVRLLWLPGPLGRGAVRARDEATWHGALWCQRCRRLGYNHDDIDAVLEAQRLEVDHAPRVVDCASCGKPACDACADQTGTMCLDCFARGPGA